MFEATTIKIEATKLELNNLKSSRSHKTVLHQTEILRLRLKMAEIKKRINLGGTNTVTTNNLPVYYAVLAEDQDTTPTAVRQQQAYLCQTLHQYEVTSRLLEKVKGQCTSLVTSLRLTIQFLEDECVEIEKKLLDEIEALRENISECKAMNEHVVRRQARCLQDLRLQNHLNPSSSGSVAEELFFLTDESVNAELRFNNSLLQSISKISTDFRNEFVLPRDTQHAASTSRWAEVMHVTHSKLSIRSSMFDASKSMCNLSELFSPNKNKRSMDHAALPSFFDSFSSLNAERLSSPIKFTPVNPVA